MTTATETIQTLYDRDGFILHRHSVLAPDLLARAAQATEDVRNGVYDTGTPPEHSQSNPGDDPRRLCKIEQPQLASHALRQAIASPELGRLAGEISGAKRVQVWWVQLLVKPSSEAEPEIGTGIGWHQDKQYWKGWSEDSELFTAWVALSDVTEASGPMIFVPGSQQWGLMDEGNFFNTDFEAVRQGINVPAGQQWREVPATLPPGGVSFHHRLTFHGSGPNTSGSTRRSLAIHLRTENSELIPGEWVGRYIDRPEICPVIFGE